MLDLKNNLRKRICDYEKDAKNTNTYLEWIQWAYKDIFEEEISEEYLDGKTNEELNELLDLLDYLIDK